MASRRTRPPKQTRRFHVEFSATSAFFWSLGLFFLLGWIFFLGILVGRGFLPDGIQTLAELKAQIARLQDTMSGKSAPAPVKKMAGDPKFRFYEELSSKKANARKALAAGKPRQDDLDKRIRALEHALAQRTTEKKTFPEAGRFTIQVASMTTEAEAVRMTRRLKRMGYAARYHRAVVKGKTYYRVRCGSFSTRAGAAKARDLLARKEGLKGFVTARE